MSAQPDSVLSFEGVIAGYGKMTILNETTAHIRKAAITTLIGPNGAGKSTLFKTVFGLLPVRAGRVRFDGVETTNWSPRRLLEVGMCYVPQGRNIFPELSVRHNLELGGVSFADQRQLQRRIAAMEARFPVLSEGDASGGDALGWPTETSRSRPRVAARPQARS